MSDDDKPDLLAQIDQVLASLKTRATILGSYFKQLRGEGFDRNEALALTIELGREMSEAEEPDE